MNSRAELHETLCGVLGITESDGDRHAYFQPPASLKIKFPAIVYKLKSIPTNVASNKIYRKNRGYEVVLIDKNPDSGYVDKILEIPYCSFDRFYTADNLNHFVFTIYN